MEILLHSVLEDEVDAHNEANRSLAPSPDGVESSIPDQPDGILTTVIEFLDHFPEALEVVVGCARKTEVERWKFLFDIVGKPRDLFEVGTVYWSVDGRIACAKASSRRQRLTCWCCTIWRNWMTHLCVDFSTHLTFQDTLRLLKRAKAANEHHVSGSTEVSDKQLCKELLRFLHSIDDSGDALRAALDIVGVPNPADRLVAPAF